MFKNSMKNVTLYANIKLTTTKTKTKTIESMSVNLLYALIVSICQQSSGLIFTDYFTTFPVLPFG